MACPRGSRVRAGQPIRLQHAGTGKWLHSHAHRSPLSNQQEVSCDGSPGDSNRNDNWVVELVEGGGEQKLWDRQHKARRKPLRRWAKCTGARAQAPPKTAARWMRRSAMQVRLRHVDTGVYLWSHNKQYPRPIQGQLEVCGAGSNARESEWIAAEGARASRPTAMHARCCEGPPTFRVCSLLAHAGVYFSSHDEF